MAAAVRSKRGQIVVFLVSFFLVGRSSYGIDPKESSLNQCKDIQNCTCTDLVIECIGRKFATISEIYPYISTRTYNISITGGRLDEIPADFLGPVTEMLETEQLINIEYLNLSGNGIQVVKEGAFSKVPYLRTLDLSDNDILESACRPSNSPFGLSLAPLANLRDLHLGRAFSEKTANMCEVGMLLGGSKLTLLTHIDLSGNGFSVSGSGFDFFTEHSYSLEYLDLSHNNFTNYVYGRGIGNLVHYDFSYNKLEYINPRATDEIENMPRLEEIDFSGNPIHCDCGMAVAYHWFHYTKQPLDFENIICQFADDKSIIGKPIMELELDDFCAEPRTPDYDGHILASSMTTFWGFIVACIAPVVVGIVVAVVVVRRRRRRQQRHLAGTPSSPERDNKTPAYSRMI